MKQEIVNKLEIILEKLITRYEAQIERGDYEIALNIMKNIDYVTDQIRKLNDSYQIRKLNDSYTTSSK